MTLISPMQNNLNIKQQLFHWHLELTNKCLLKCPRCPRTEAKGKYKVMEMDLDFIKRIFSQKRLESVEKILLCGGEGDPIYCNDFLKIVRFLKEKKPSLCISIITNGSYKKPEWWQELGSILNAYDILTFSIDGWNQESNEKYRINSDWDSILVGIKNVQPTSALLNWSTIYFKFNEDKVFDIRNLAASLGFNLHTLVESNLFGYRLKQYIDPETNSDPLQPSLNKMSSIGRHIKKSVWLNDKEELRSGFKKAFDEQTDKVKKATKDWHIMPLCKTGDRSLYISAEGYLYPCSWVTHPYHGLKRSKLRENVNTSWEKSFFINNREKRNLRNYSIDEVLNSSFWDECESFWYSGENVPIICEQKCLNKC